MGTKTSDYNTIPLCTELHYAVHQDPVAWELRFGKQINHLKRIQQQAIEAGKLDANNITT